VASGRSSRQHGHHVEQPADRRDDPVRAGRRQQRRVAGAAEDADRGHSRRAGGLHVERRVADVRRVARRDLEPRRARQQSFRIRFAARDLFSRDDGVEQLEQARPFERRERGSQSIRTR